MAFQSALMKPAELIFCPRIIVSALAELTGIDRLHTAVRLVGFELFWKPEIEERLAMML